MEKTLQIAVTSSGSRTFGGQFTVTWTPSSTAASVVVAISGGANQLTNNTFVPGNNTQPVSGGDGTYSVSGTIIVAFNNGGTTGTILGQDLKFTAPNGGSTTFNGWIGGF